mmetsp:Transcript_21928/g.89170  ORF Transcript_21928/g.89170 Transcript_21928/m.89170 type:complete len:146 (-) Transcript_21928:1282-1719(-)
MEPQTVSESYQVRLRASMHANACVLVVLAVLLLSWGDDVSKTHAAWRFVITTAVEIILFLWAAWLFRAASLEPIPYQEAVSLAAANIVCAVVNSLFVVTNPFKFYRLKTWGIVFFSALGTQGLCFGVLQYYLLRNDVFRYTAILV